MPYIDRDQAGNIVGIYANPQREGQEFAASAELLTPPLSKAQRIAAKLQAGNFPTKGHLYYFIENMRTVAALDLGITKEQAHDAGMAGNPMYLQMVVLYNQILEIEAEA